MCVQALLPFTPAGQEEEAGWGVSQDAAAGTSDAGGPSSSSTDPLKQLPYLLLLLNASILLPCIAALQFRQHHQQLQQAATERQMRSAAPDGQVQESHVQAEVRTDIFCGFGFSRHPEQHLQLQQLVMEAGIKAAQMLAVSHRSLNVCTTMCSRLSTPCSWHPATSSLLLRLHVATLHCLHRS
jgi:hypothetical protein